MSRFGYPQMRVQRAASMLASSLSFLLLVARDEGVEVPTKVLEQVLEVRKWARSLTDPPVPRQELPEP